MSKPGKGRNRKSNFLRLQESEQIAQQKAELREALAKEEAIKARLKAKPVSLTFNWTVDPAKSFVAKAAPKLIEDTATAVWVSRLLRFATDYNISLPENWEPKGKAPTTQFLSLAETLSKYKMPKFLWNVFTFGPRLLPVLADAGAMQKHPLEPFVAGILRGDSVYNLVTKENLLNVPLTRKMCHVFMETKDEISIRDAIRLAQFKVHGGNERLAQAFIKTLPDVHSPYVGVGANEVFWDSFVAWVCKIAMFDPAKLQQVRDYVNQRRMDDNTFSMKGRTGGALLRDVDDWHNQLNKSRKLRGETYQPCGIKKNLFDMSKKRTHTGLEDGVAVERTTVLEKEIWLFVEILSDKRLLYEGQNMRHCVASYGYSIKTGSISIWSLQLDKELNHEDPRLALTLEVSNKDRVIRQVRGYCNRVANPRERQIISSWAVSNGLEERYT